MPSPRHSCQAADNGWRKVPESGGSGQSRTDLPKQIGGRQVHVSYKETLANRPGVFQAADNEIGQIPDVQKAAPVIH